MQHFYQLTAVFSALLLLPSCVMADRGGGQYVLRAKTGEDASKRAEKEQAHRDLVKLNHQVEGFKQFWRDAMAGGSSGGSGSGSDSGDQSSGSSFTGNGKNDMTVTYDKLAGSAPTSGTNTINVRLGSHAYSLTYDFYPGSYLLDGGGDLTGMTVNVKFESGRPVTAKNYQRGTGYVTIKSCQSL